MAAGETEGASRQHTSPFALACNNGLFMIDAEEVPLSEVLREISRRTGAEFQIREDSLASDRISLSVTGLTFSEAIARVLDEYSYVLEYGDGVPVRIIILALRDGGQAPAVSSNPVVLPKATPDGKKDNKFEQVEIAAPDPPPDRCRELWSSGGEGPPDPKSRLDKTAAPARIHDILTRAGMVLAAKECAHLWERVLEGLTGISDDQVTSMLARIAETGQNAGIRAKATEVLWHNTARSEFYNASGVRALERLSRSTDEGVSLYARHGLEDYRNYVERAQSGSSEPPQQKQKVDQ